LCSNQNNRTVSKKKNREKAGLCCLRLERNSTRRPFRGRFADGCAANTAAHPKTRDLPKERFYKIHIPTQNDTPTIRTRYPTETTEWSNMRENGFRIDCCPFLFFATLLVSKPMMLMLGRRPDHSCKRNDIVCSEHFAKKSAMWLVLSPRAPLFNRYCRKGNENPRRFMNLFEN